MNPTPIGPEPIAWPTDDEGPPMMSLVEGERWSFGPTARERAREAAVSEIDDIKLSRAIVAEALLEHANDKIARRVAKTWFTQSTVKRTDTKAGYLILTGHLGDLRIDKIIPDVVLRTSVLGPVAVIAEMEQKIRGEFEKSLRTVKP